jgi:8-oxo-dGTP pyrophosphatase MutT (NUDIX family)
VTIWIDPPGWWAHARRWSHLVSDDSYDELHAFAASVGLPRRSYEGDHYDVPEERYAAVVAAGARPVPGRELIRILHTSGLRLRKRRGERGVDRVRGVGFPDGTTADVDLVAAPREAAESRVFAAMVFTTDRGGDYAVVWSNRRQEWGAPGGWREPGESPRDNAVREAREETGLALRPEDLTPVGYERFHPHHRGGLWVEGRDLLQVFRTGVDAVRPPLVGESDVYEPRWVTGARFTELSGGQFWWPLAAHVLGLSR